MTAGKPYRHRFRAIFAGYLAFLALAAFGLYYAAPGLYHGSLGSHTNADGSQVAEADWGHVRAFDGALMFVLAPNTDERRKYELGFGRVTFTSGGIIVADDDHMTNATVLNGEPMGACGYHWQGAGVNVLVAIGKCVPSWATVTGSPGVHAREWVRVENVGPRARVVVLRYQ